MTSPQTASIPLDHAQRWRAFWVCVSVAALTILDLSKVNVALPSIESAFGAGSTQLQIVVSGYVLMFGLALVPFGRLGDQRSRKTLFLVGLTLFLAMSVVCALAPTVEILIAGRLVQGLAAGIQMPQVLGTIQQIFVGKERGQAFGLFGATIGIATAIGPTLGGLMIAVGGAQDGWWERRYAASGRSPLVPFRLFSISSFRNGTLVVTTYFTAIPAMFLLTTLFLQAGVGLEPVYAGMVSIGFAVVSAGSAWIGGNLVGRLGRPLVVGGLVIVLVSIVALAIVAYTVPADAVAYAMAGVMAIAGAGAGLVVAPNQTLTLADIPTRSGGLAGSVGQLGQRIGTAVGTAVGLSLFYSTIYRESDADHHGLEVYHDAYAYGMVAVGIFVALALLIGVIDLGARRRAQRS